MVFWWPGQDFWVWCISQPTLVVQSAQCLTLTKNSCIKVGFASLCLRRLFVQRHEFASSWIEAAIPRALCLFVLIYACHSPRTMSVPPPRPVSKEVILVGVRISVRRHELQAAAPASPDCVRCCHFRILVAWEFLHLQNDKSVRHPRRV